MIEFIKYLFLEPLSPNETKLEKFYRIFIFVCILLIIFTVLVGIILSWMI